MAVDGVSFVAPGRARSPGCSGPNGAGKTTSLRMVSALVRPDRGHAEVDGFDTATRSRMQVLRRLGVLPDARGLYPRLTARENVRYYGRLHGLDGEPLERGDRAPASRCSTWASSPIAACTASRRASA